MSFNYITLTSPNTASLLIEGYMLDKTTNVFLSSSTVTFPSLTSINTFVNSPVVSAICPSFSGYSLSSKYFDGVDSNHLIVNIPNVLSGHGNVDIIFYNRSGYTKLSDRNFLIHLP